MTSEHEENPQEEQESSPITLVPHDRQVAARARNTVVKPTLRVSDLASIIVLDPTLAVELLRAANSIKLAGDKKATASVNGAIIRLGSLAIAQRIDDLSARTCPALETINPSLQSLRARAVATARIAKIFASEINNGRAEECLLAGLLYNYGEFLTVVKLEDQYTKLASTNTRAGLIYRLHNQFRINLETVCGQYLARVGLPASVVSAVSTIGNQPGGQSSAIRPLILASVELLDAFQEDRISRFAPGKTPPARTAVRMLSLSNDRYERAFEQIRLVLDSLKNGDEASIEFEDTHDKTEIQGVDPSQIAPPTNNGIAEAPPPIAPVETIAAITLALDTAVSLEDRVMQAPGWSDISTIIMESLCRPHHFMRTAIIVLHNRQVSITFDGPGGTITEKSKTIPLSSDLAKFLQPGVRVSPLVTDTTPESPFGSRIYAIGNLADTPYSYLFIYADCGEGTCLPLDARRMFRRILDLVTARLLVPPPPLGIPLP